MLPAYRDMFCKLGNAALDAMVLAPSYEIRVESLRDVIALYDREIALLERVIHTRLRDHKGYHVIQGLNGIGRTIAAILVAEIGDVSRFRSPTPCAPGPGSRRATANPT